MDITAAVNNGLIFPISNYVKSIENVPKYGMEEIESYYYSRARTDRHFEKSYKYLVENYVNSETLESHTDTKNDIVYTRTRCYRSQKKNDKGHLVVAAFRISIPKILDAYCECAAGVRGTCNHSVALLRLLSLLRLKDIHTPPAEVSCTDKPQKWNRPRGEKILPLSVLDMNLQAPKKGGSSSPILCRLYEPVRNQRHQNEVVHATRELVDNLNKGLENQDGWASLLSTTNLEESQWVQTKMGFAAKGSPLSLQLALHEYGYEVIHNLDERPMIQLKRKEEPFPANYELPSHSTTDSRPWTVHGTPFRIADPKILAVLKKIQLTNEEAKAIERNTREQSNSQQWKDERSIRLSSSKFGLVCQWKNQKWTKPGINNVVYERDISHLPAIKYGKRFEEVARRKYQEKMKNMGHNIIVKPSGYVIDPSQPWIGSSPDGLIYDPTEACPYGVLEVKCPSSMKKENPSSALNGDYHLKLVSGKPTLSETHPHYFQIMGQMGVSGLRWGDYVTFFPSGLIIIRVRFDPKKWENIEFTLKKFYFSHMLPKIASQFKTKHFKP